MALRLNIGCGKAQLPTTPDSEATKHLAHLPETAFSEPWVNVDRVALPGVEEVVDLFAYPWVKSSNGNPWNTSSVAEIWASHLFEHIPHMPRYTGAARIYPVLERAGQLDGWYAFLTEVWRVLEPGGLLHIISPYAWSTPAMADPTHTRYLVPAVFSYLKPNPDAPFDYEIPCEFEAVMEPFVRLTKKGQDIVELTNVHRKKQAGLDPDTDDFILTDEDVRNVVGSGLDMADEFYICLAAVKDK